MKKPNFTDNQRQIQAERLKSIMNEKGVNQAYLVKYLWLQTFTDYETKFPKYIRGQLSMPLHIIPLVASCLNIDPGFFTDVDSYTHSFFSGDYSYSGYLKYKNFEIMSSDDFYSEYSKKLSIFDFQLGVHDDGGYEIFDKSGFNLRLSKNDLIGLIDNIKQFIMSYKKEGDAID